MRHFIDTNGLPAVVKFVEPRVIVHAGSLMRDWDRVLRQHHKGDVVISRIQINEFTQGSIFVEKDNTSPWAGRWICTNHNTQHRIRLSAATTEAGAVNAYNAGIYDREKGYYKSTERTEKQMAAAIKANETQQRKHYNITTLEFVETLPPEFKSLVEKFDAVS
jgi:hypothetical protein